MNRRCMLIILLLCVLKTSGQNEELTDEDYNHDYSDTPEIGEVNVGNLSTFSTISPPDTNTKNIEQDIDTTTIPPTTIPTTIFTTTIPTTTTTSKPTDRTTEANKEKCPKMCKCFDDQVNCSHQKLDKIPKNLPYRTALLNLSDNHLAVLNVSDLINYSHLRQLILNDNRIETIINEQAFGKLPNLHHIDLSRNALKPLHGTEFSRARGLATLILAGNKDVVAPNSPIVQTLKLKTLNLANCSITNFSDNIFENLTSLVQLYLEDNPLESDLNVNSFKYLINLRTLHIPKINEEVARKLCDKLETLDMVQLTAQSYDLSCFILTSDPNSKFEDSLVKIGQTTLSAVDIESNELYKIYTNAPPLKTSKSPKTTLAPNTKDKSFGTEERKFQSSQKMSPISQNETKIEHIGVNDTTTEEMGEKINQLSVAPDTIYLILTIVIAITLAALIIGLFCRLDCCGVKTKCCRRTHNRAETGDRVQPHEEIPLNKV